MLDILYLVGNTGDAAVARRASMLRAGGASVGIAGFRRSTVSVPPLDGEEYYDLGQTFDGRFVQRIMATSRAAVRLRSRMRGRRAPDVILARNLEMLFLAARLSELWASRPAIVYECLDIHRLMLRPDVIGHSLRRLERHLARKASLVLVSSPAFSREYFDNINPLGLPVRLIENKVYGATARARNPAFGTPAGRAIRVGWFGALRCSRSLDVLGASARALGGGLEVVLRGRPALTEFADFHGTVAANPYLRFEGAYNNPDDLAAIYGDVHLVWAIDYFEDGKNSKWLLPNRLYEGCFNGAIPIALAGTETAALLEAKNIGIVVDDTSPDSLIRLIDNLTPATLRELAAAVARIPASDFACDTRECRELVSALVPANRMDGRALEVAA